MNTPMNIYRVTVRVAGSTQSEFTPHSPCKSTYTHSNVEAFDLYYKWCQTSDVCYIGGYKRICVELYDITTEASAEPIATYGTKINRR